MALFFVSLLCFSNAPPVRIAAFCARDISSESSNTSDVIRVKCVYTLPHNTWPYGHLQALKPGEGPLVCKFCEHAYRETARLRVSATMRLVSHASQPGNPPALQPAQRSKKLFFIAFSSSRSSAFSSKVTKWPRYERTMADCGWRTCPCS